MKIDDHLSIEYESEMWLRFLSKTSYSSVLMGRKRVNKFAEFLKTLPQVSTYKLERIGDLTLYAEKFEGDKFDIALSLQPYMSVLFTIGSHQVDELVNHLLEGELTDENQLPSE